MNYSADETREKCRDALYNAFLKRMTVLFGTTSFGLDPLPVVSV